MALLSSTGRTPAVVAEVVVATVVSRVQAAEFGAPARVLSTRKIFEPYEISACGRRSGGSRLSMHEHKSKRETIDRFMSERPSQSQGGAVLRRDQRRCDLRAHRRGRHRARPLVDEEGEAARSDHAAGDQRRELDDLQCLQLAVAPAIRILV